MNKPISVVLEDAKKEIITTINKQGLHPYILHLIMKDIYLETLDNAKNIYQKEYQNYINKSEDDKNANNKADDK